MSISNNEIDILCGLMIEAANTDGKITQEELNKISHSLITIFKEDPEIVEESLTKAFENKDNSRSLYYYTSKLNKSYSNENKIITGRKAVILNIESRLGII